MDQQYKIAIYLRLSKEDRSKLGESDSIANQRMMLESYIRKNLGHSGWKEFSDDGYSGTNFRRPGVMDMLEQIREGEIDCVIVKDFSRFSRDHIELGSYLDQIFPFLGVRFISLNDGYDSAEHRGSTTELGTSFQGLMYDLYSKDLSVKVRSALRIRKERGQYACADTPFGYVKDPQDRHRLIIAEDEARIVRMIFLLALEGKTSAKIERLINKKKVQTPMEFKLKKVQTRRSLLKDRPQWERSVIYRILRNPVYAGDMVYGKYEKDEVGGKSHLKPKSGWKILQDHHAAIIPRDIFEKVQEQWRSTERTKPKGEEHRHPLQGKVFCGGCKRAMRLRERNRNPYFYCDMRYGHTDTEDHPDNINLMFLEQVVLYKMHTVSSREEGGGTELTAESVNTRIQKIVVYGEKHIEIQWKSIKSVG